MVSAGNQSKVFSEREWRAVADAQSSMLMAFHMATTNQADAVVNR
jgi:hypothetical protein